MIIVLRPVSLMRLNDLQPLSRPRYMYPLLLKGCVYEACYKFNLERSWIFPKAEAQRLFNILGQLDR